MSAVRPELRSCAFKASLGVTVVYLAAGIGWIVGSDAAVQAISSDPQWLSTAQTYKGIGYVVLTATLLCAGLYGVNRSLLRHRERADVAAVRAREVVEALNATLEGKVRRRTRELELANAELEAFTRSAAHDLKNPLNGIAGFAQLLGEHCARRGDAEAERLLSHMTLSVDTMRALIDDLMALSRVSLAEIASTEVDLSSLARNLVDTLAGEQPERRVEVTVAPGLAARGDPGLLRCLLDNLIGNAWKYTAQCPQARIEIGRVDAGPQGSAVYVRDNGAGFAMDKAARLFEPFQRFHPASQFPGTGVGLATCKRIVERHGGTIWARSEPGEGSTFFFSLGS